MMMMSSRDDAVLVGVGMYVRTYKSSEHYSHRTVWKGCKQSQAIQRWVVGFRDRT